MLTLKNVAVGYNKKSIIEDVNFTVAPGEIVTLIGPNGSGKSTILKSVIGQIPIIKGEITVDEKNLSEIKNEEKSKFISIVMTEKIKTELMTCMDVVATGRYPYTNFMGVLAKEDKEIVENALKKVSANDVADADFMKISDGQRQRVMLARALTQEPKLMVLDEPTSHLDIKYKLSMMRVIKELAKKEKIAILMSLHELELAKMISDKIVCVAEGRIDKIGTSKEVFEEGYIEKLFDIEKEDYELWRRL